MTDPFLTLLAAVRSDDLVATRSILQSDPALCSKLNDPTPDSFGSPIIFAAAEKKNTAMIDLLVASGADINQRSHWWAGPFHILEGCDSAFVPELVARGAVLGPHAAARCGMFDELAALITQDPRRVHERGGDGKSPLHYASNIAIAKLLLDCDADVNMLDIDHESTAAQWLVAAHADVARYLLTRGSRTDILLASSLGAVDLVRRYLDDDPDSIHTRVTPDWFPMQNTRAGGTIYNWTLGGGKTAHIVARDAGHDDVFALLMERSDDVLKLVVACTIHDAAAVDALLASDADLASELEGDDLAQLGRVASFNDVAGVRLLLRAGWPVDARFDGATALHWAAFHGNIEAVRLLLAHGAPTGLRDPTYDGRPAEWAEHGANNSWHRKTGDYPAVIAALVNA